MVELTTILNPATTIASSGASRTLSIGNTVDPVFDVTLTANCTLTLAASPIARRQSIEILLRQDATGGRVATLPGAKWAGGVAPSLTTTPGGLDIIRFVTLDGTNWIGSVVALNIAAVSGTPPPPPPPPPPSGATFTVASLPPKRTWQRSTFTGGGNGKGAGTVPVAVNVTAAGALYARVRQDGGTTILQAPWLVSSNAQVGSGSINVTGVDASAAWGVLELSGNGTSGWVAATSAMMVCAHLSIWGQSIAGDMITSLHDSNTIAQTGVVPSDATYVYAALWDNNGNFKPGAWGPWVTNVGDGTGAPYISAGGAKLAKDLVALLGVGVTIVGCPRGNRAVETFTSGGDVAPVIRDVMAAVGGFEMAWMEEGHSDSIGDTSARKFISGLSNAFAFLSSLNPIPRSAVTAIVGTIINVGSGDSGTLWGTATQKNRIRRAGYEFAKGELTQLYGRALYVNAYNITQSDGTHPNQAGAVQLANVVSTAISTAADQPAGDQNLPAVAKYAGSAAQPVSFGSAGRFGGTALIGGSVSLDGEALPMKGPMTIGFWMKKAAPPPDLQFLFGSSGNNSLGMNGGGVLQEFNGGSVAGTRNLADGAWHWVTIEEDHDPFDGSAPSIKVYADGLFEVSPPSAAGDMGRTSILRAFDAGTGYLFDPSTISDFQVWRRLLNGAVPTASPTGSEPFLHTYLPLNGNLTGLA